MHFADGKDASNFCHPVGNDVNYSGGSKPGWSSHWGSVQGFNVTEEVSLSLSLSLCGIKKKDKVRGDRKYSRSERPVRRHVPSTWIPLPGTWLLSDAVSEATDLNCGSWDTSTQRKIYSWACATTASHTLSGAASHKANCNWAVNLLFKSRGLQFSHKLRLCENPGICLMNYVCHKHWPSGRKDDLLRL